jgi:hypothetical protein
MMLGEKARQKQEMPRLPRRYLKLSRRGSTVRGRRGSTVRDIRGISCDRPARLAFSPEVSQSLRRITR